MLIDERFLRRAEVEEKVGLARTAIYERIANQTFPAPLHLGGNCVRWKLSDVVAWMVEQEQRGAA